MTNIFLDAEWFQNQNIFLLGYAYNISTYNYLLEHQITKENIHKIFKPVDGFVFFYGPDIGMLEKNIGDALVYRYFCVNMLRLVKHYIPGLSSYKLSDVEDYLGIERIYDEYKTNIFDIWRDWKNPVARKRIMAYNREDVINLPRILTRLRQDYDLKNKDIECFRLL